MKKVSSILLIIVLLFSCLSLAGCGSAKLEFYILNDFFNDSDILRELNWKLDLNYNDQIKDRLVEDNVETESEEKVVCCVNAKSSNDGQSIKIPEEYEGKKVVGVISNSELSLNLNGKLPENLIFISSCNFEPEGESFVLPENTSYIYDSFNKTNKIKDLVFKGEIMMLEKSFEQSAFEQVTFINHAGPIKESFNSCDNLESVVFDKSAFRVESSFNKCPELCKAEFNGDLTTVNDSFNECLELETVEIKGSAAYISESFKDDFLDHKKINEAMTEKLQAAELSNTDASIPKDPKIMIRRGDYQDYYYPFEACEELPYGATNLEEANLLVVIYADTSIYGKWVDKETNRYIKDAKSCEFYFSLYRLDNNKCVNKEDKKDSHSVIVDYNVSNPLQQSEIMTALREYLEKVIK